MLTDPQAEDAWHGSSARRTHASLYLPAGLSLACYAIISMIAVQPNYGLAAPLPVSGFMSGGGPFAEAARFLGISSLSRKGLAVLYFCMLIVLFAAYAWAMFLLVKRGKSASTLFIVGIAALFCAFMLFLPAVLARDVYNYIFYGKAISAYGKNPYLVAASAYPRDPATSLIEPYWRSAVSVYGPLFTYLSALLTSITGNSIFAGTLAFKLVTFGFFLGSVALVSDLTRRLFSDKSTALVLSAAWSPMVIIYLVGGAHNDLIMIFFILLGFVLYRRGRPVLAVSSLMLAALIKSTALIFLVPLLVLFLRDNARWSLRKYAEAVAALVALPIVFYLPIWPGVSGARKIISVGSGFSGQSIAGLFRNTMRKALVSSGISYHSAARLSVRTSQVLFVGLFLALLVVFCWKVRDFRSLLLYSGLIMTAFVFTATWLMPWYLGTAVFLVALSGSFNLIGVIACASLVISFYGNWINPFRYDLVPIVLLLVALYLVFTSAYRLRSTAKRLPLKSTTRP